MVTVDATIRVFQYKILTIFFVNKMPKFKKFNHRFALSAKQKMQFTYIYFIGAEKPQFYGDNFGELFRTFFDIPSILSQGVIFGFLDDELRTKNAFKPHITDLQKLLT